MSWVHDGIRFELALDLRIPQLKLTWPRIAAMDGDRSADWEDEAGFGLDVLADAAAWRPIAGVAGPLTDTLRAAVAAAGPRATEERGRASRTWSRTICRGFLPADYDFIDTLTVTPAGARSCSYTQQYAHFSDEQRCDVSLAELADPACALRPPFALCLPRIDLWLALLRCE